MAGYVELGEVRTWYDEKGGGEPLVLMHPGGADARAWAPNIDALAARFHVFTPERRGHGRTPDVEGPISYELMAQDTIAFLDGVVAGPAHLVGWSAGASVALEVAVRRPDLARRLVLIGVSSTATAGSPPRSIRTRTPPSLSRRATPSSRPRVPTTSRWSPRSWRA
jgi:pimeloyl-ACP methyl ester carboxylesterase